MSQSALFEAHLSKNMKQWSTSLHKKLSSWFLTHKRSLPWRRTRDPYLIWISEIMLQQTQVVKVIDYYNNFTAAFPNIEILASTPLDNVLKYWAGLGYYSRCRNIHKCAQFISQNLQGSFPTTVDELLYLPGIGPYTARAISSIAFRQNVGVIDGNVKRVMARFLNISTRFESRDETEMIQSYLDREAETALHPGDFNESIMELGATICKVSQPLCESCPLKGTCLSRANQTQKEIPPPKKRKAAKRVTYRVSLDVDKYGILVQQNINAGLFGGLWVFPYEPYTPKKENPDIPLFEIEHILTHRKMMFHIFLEPPTQSELKEERIPLEFLADLGRPRWVDKIIEQAILDNHIKTKS